MIVGWAWFNGFIKQAREKGQNMRWNMKADETVSECGNVCDECGIECPCGMWACRGMVSVRDITLCMFKCEDME